MKDRKGGEPRRLDDQEDGGDGVRAKDRGKGDKLRGDDGRKRRRDEEIDSRNEIKSGGEDDGRGMEELGSRITNYLKENVREMKQQGAGIFKIFKTHANDNVTGKVKELVTSFEKLGCSGVNLKSKNHESRFKESIGKSYLSPEKRQKEYGHRAEQVGGGGEAASVLQSLYVYQW